MKHLRKKNLTYLQHYFRVLRMTAWCFKMYVVCCIHAAFPFWFEDTFSNEVKRLAAKFEDEDAQRR